MKNLNVWLQTRAIFSQYILIVKSLASWAFCSHSQLCMLKAQESWTCLVEIMITPLNDFNAFCLFLFLLFLFLQYNVINCRRTYDNSWSLYRFNSCSLTNNYNSNIQREPLITPMLILNFLTIVTTNDSPGWWLAQAVVTNSFSRCGIK